MYQPTNAHIISYKTHLKHFKTLRHVSTLSDHHQGALFLAKVILQYSQFNSYLQTRCCGSISCCVGMCCGAVEKKYMPYILSVLMVFFTNLMHKFFILIHLHVSSTIVLIFRRTIVLVQHLLSSLSVGDCSVHRLQE